MRIIGMETLWARWKEPSSCQQTAVILCTTAFAVCVPPMSLVFPKGIRGHQGPQHLVSPSGRDLRPHFQPQKTLSAGSECGRRYLDVSGRKPQSVTACNHV